ncbi:MAG: B12-binding domain-containing radical SAM protein [Omnitrophica WOR_2 bacterium GWF2_38_59]|nr:MAG: B12-binding domain-containing radical SAM protein [Omnitrophica WOR_2 bacterium GWF2_38_59]OGX48250.1 MAG: B12-binding domain-containing radical SAM protein [Omnitrophica WOR_2 bacterium RIFOXYA2_FULL_38_17]OGX54045.1 MAG: B12-binding domain-containing radical SAM protein [Omnitrophica WOR_2 bacterium RIFOXYA12_FULL_38_10]OGX59585.1 MAG: B12-binding domain-containing radical SAM protein [Omnitrophica WOR_2 bacterium RIFOXYC2_FULL_38_12]OGX59977.1 MAG: B12-binding domain-containing radic
MKILFVVYDNGSYIHSFPIGIAYLASALRKNNHEVVIYNQDIHHYKDEGLTRYLDENDFDVVGIGVIAGYYQYRKLLKISEAINTSSNRPKHYVLGGHGPTPDPEYFLNITGADIVVMGEGEVAFLNLLKAIECKEALNNVLGIAFKEEDKIIINPRQPLIEDIDTIEWPAYDMFAIDHYRLTRSPNSTNEDFSMPILSARGCTFKCNFCYRMDEGYRTRKPEAIIEEIQYLRENYGINYIEFMDELLMSSKQRIIEVCEAIIKSKLKFKWYCNGRLNYAKAEELKLMKKAGCVFINYGIEAFDDDVLRKMNKSLSTTQIEEGIVATLKERISPGFNIIFGHIGDTKETLNKGVEFLLKYDDGAQMRTIRPVTPYPGSPLYYHAIEKGLLKDCEDFYENKHSNSDLLAVNFTDMTDNEFHESLFEANSRLLENYFRNKKKSVIQQARELYLDHNVNFRGFRQT